MKAEEFVEDLEMILDYKIERCDSRKPYDRVLALFQAALDAPIPFVDGYVPEEKGWYLYESDGLDVQGKKGDIVIVWVQKNENMYYDGVYWGSIKQATGRFSHRIQVEGE